MGRKGEEPKLGRGAFVDGLPLQENEKERQSTQMRGCRRLAISIARLEQLTLGKHDRWIWEYSWLSDTGAIFGAREEFIFGGKHEGLLRWPQNR
jgi:hypothetical protein